MVYTGFEWIQSAQNKGQGSQQRRMGSQRIRSLDTVKGGSIQRPHRPHKKKRHIADSAWEKERKEKTKGNRRNGSPNI